MCAGAIFWAGVRRVVYALGADRVHEILPPTPDAPVMRLSCRDVLGAGTRPTEVVGPLLEDEAEQVFAAPGAAPGPAARWT
jgi:tRNA(Arg) A34 adenosine deaminase TadA